MLDNIRTVKFMSEQNAEDLFICKETGRVYIRMRDMGDKFVRWLTSSKWTGGYEADTSMREGLIIRVVDKQGNLLFEEQTEKMEGRDGTWAEKKGPFSWEALADMARAAKEEYGLLEYEKWKAWLLASMPDDQGRIEWNTWVYGPVERKPVEILKKLSVLGQTVFLTRQKEKHNFCEKRWETYEIRDNTLTSCRQICGYSYKEGEK